MSDMYTSGKYLQMHPSWHSEDSPWKAEKVRGMIEKHGLHPRSIADIGCGAGAVLDEISKKLSFRNTTFSGYDTSPQAIAIAQRTGNPACKFYCQDVLAPSNALHFDILLAIDVMEHVPDYLGFLAKCVQKATYKIYHIPLDIHVSSVLRNAYAASRYTAGHLHYFGAVSALASLKDTGHTIVDYTYTSGALDLVGQHPSIKTTCANIPRWLLSRFSVPLAARMLGGYSLLVLAK